MNSTIDFLSGEVPGGFLRASELSAPWIFALAAAAFLQVGQTDAFPVDTIDAFPIHRADFVMAAQSLPYPATASTEPILFFIIDFSDFMCPACLDSLLNVCRLLPHHILRERACGVVVFPHGSKEGSSRSDSAALSRSVKIMEQKIRGFRKANRIPFPLLLDRNSIFRSLAGDGTTVILLDPLQGSILKISFPMSAADAERLLTIWLPEEKQPLSNLTRGQPVIDYPDQELYSH